MERHDLFFPMLERREFYTRKSDGEFYSYDRYRREIREDCLGRCVYCDSHENEMGGEEYMQLDHFRPASLNEFAHLTNDPYNLVWSCARCNLLKSNTWPALGTPGSVRGAEGFLEPFSDDRSNYFSVLDDGELAALKPPAQYLVMLLSLNRASLKRIRELRYLKWCALQEIEIRIDEIEDRLRENPTVELGSLLAQQLESWRRIQQVQARLLDFALY